MSIMSIITTIKRRFKGVARGPRAAFAATTVITVALCPAYALSESLEEIPEVVNPHNFVVKKYCSSCHTEKPPELSFDAVTTCTKCHPENIGNHPVARHPLGKKAGIDVPGLLPLTADGRLVCHTCHDPHNRSMHRKMLRVDYFKLCASCHKGY